MAISGGRSARVVCALVVAALVAVAPAAATAEVVSPTTTSLLPALLDSPNLTGFDPSSPDACTAGRPLCLQKVIKEMTKRSDPLIAGCDHNAAFSLLYLRVTQAISAHISADRQSIAGSHAANPDFRGSIRAEDGGQVFVYHGGLDLDETGEFVVAPGPNVVLEVIDASAIAARGRPASAEAVAGHGAVHVELRPAAAKRLPALLLAQHAGHRVG